ncbi:hypothetical protein RND81_05G171400 [Saponaria officinalis]|uniref:Pentatricopeptide repeat-containing protein n=1 Tax=Saponaria officinalis TaxID=3572 RepID=A0AAW1L059_SAPOF
MLFSAISFQLRRTQLMSSSSLAKSFSKTTLNTSINVGFDIIRAKETCYIELLKNAHHTSDLFHGKTVHAQIIKNSCLSNSTFLHNFLLSMYLNFSDFDSALQLFDEMPQRNVVSWTSLVSGFVRRGFPANGLYFFTSMLRDDVLPNGFTLVAALNACSFGWFGYGAYEIYGLVIKLGFECNVFVRNAFLTALIKNECFEGAITVFNGYLDKDIVSWNAMISGYLQFSPSEIPVFLLRMIREGMKPDGFTFSAVFSGLAEIRDELFGTQVHGQLVRYGHGTETCVGNSVLDMYLNFGNLVDGFKVFHEISAKNVLSWTAMATGCVTYGAPNKALEILLKMKTTGVKPNRYSIATTFKACASIASLNEGEKIHCTRIKLGSEMDVCVDNALLDMYAKCGCMDNALKVFKRMKNRTIVTWTTMVMGFAQNGLPREALGVFDEMVSERFEPNSITFVCVLYACSQAGFVDEGLKYFSSMSRLGILPTEDHYICMVDLLGRAGRVKEAEELISRMPFEPGALIWQSLLGSCHIHGDIDIGKRAAAALMQLNDSGASTYVTLSNMFAGLSNWDGSEALRDMMKFRKMSKNRGASSVTSINVDKC